MRFGILVISPAELLRRLERRVQELAGLPADCCFLSLIPGQFHLLMPPADNFITIFPGNFPVWQSVVTGSGGPAGAAWGSNLGFDAQVTISNYNRVSSDQELRSGTQISSDTLGIMKKTMDLVSALQFWECPDPGSDPDEEGISPLREPMRLMDPGLRVEPKNVKGGLWASLTSIWSIRFTALG